MNLIRTAIDRPVAVIAVVMMTIMFGLVALQTIPIQLAPDVNRPVITINTTWPGAAPAEVEREIINRQEEQMAGLEGLQSISSSASQGSGRMTLEFDLSADMDRSLLLVSNRLDRVTGYPAEVDQPTLDTAGNDDSPIAWFIIRRAEGVNAPIHTFGDFVEDVIKDRLERVPGVSRVDYFGGSEREIQITVRPEVLASYEITVSELVKVLRAANISASAGYVDEGKRRYLVRTEGEINTLQATRDLVIRTGSGNTSRLTLGDIAVIEQGYKEPGARIRMLSSDAIALNAKRQTGANVIETMDGLEKALAELNERLIPDAGLSMIQVYDETVYIDSAISLVQQNIWIGGLLAATILMLFLRSLRATLVVVLSIPVSVIGAFVAMAALGRSLNVVSLAGLAFAVGMVVDAAIVVLENIYRHREKGYSTGKAAYLGASQVWSAVLVSALTTVMVFIPILTMELEAGQLFRDIAVAISVAVVLSLLVSITVIPALAKNLLKGANAADAAHHGYRLEIPIVDGFARRFTQTATGFTSYVIRSRKLAFTVVTLVTVLAIVSAWAMLPKLEYLPEGNRNLLFGIIIPPPGYNLDTTTEIAKRTESMIKPWWVSYTGPDAAPPEEARMERFFYVATRNNTFLGAVAEDPSRINELKPVLRRAAFQEPGTFGFITQPSIFGRGIGGGRRIELDISGADLETIIAVAGRAFSKIVQILPRNEGHEWRPNPGLELGAPEIRVVPDRIRLADNDLSATDLAISIDTFNDGLRVTQVSYGSKLIDVTLKGPENGVKQTQGIDSLPIVNSRGEVFAVSSLASVFMTAGPTEILHKERFRTITIEVRPAQQLPLESAIELLESEVINALHKEGLPSGIKMKIAGTADKLSQTRDALAINLALALMIVYLVMAVLFESFVYPLIILLSVPIAAVGGILGLAAVNIFAYQPLDMLTMLGFVILVGIVVNNAILLVHQALYHFREEHLPPHQAIMQATRHRIRPIFMSTLTSVFGMLPLVLFPGAGSELYRGLGSVVVGGLSLSAVLTLLIVPPMMAILVAPLEAKRKKQKTTEEDESPTLT